MNKSIKLNKSSLKIEDFKGHALEQNLKANMVRGGYAKITFKKVATVPNELVRVGERVFLERGF